MTPRTVFYAASLAVAAALLYGSPNILDSARAQEVKEQWDIDSPPPANADTNYKGKPAGEAKAAAAPAADAKGDVAKGGVNAHGLEIIKNPYTGDEKAIAEGKELFVSKACSGCHGAGGGGGMCPPVINDTWVYGADDTTLFNLVKLGSTGLQAKGYSRIGHENVVGDMPAFDGVVTADEEWKLIAYIRSKYAGDPAEKSW